MNQVTVVIPNYNGIKYIRECLQTLRDQEEDTPEYETIVVDNGSSDGSVGVIEEEFPEVSLIRLSENTGFCHAVNVGIENAHTPFVILLNNDTKVYPDFIKALYRAMDADKALFAVSAQMLMWDDPELLDDAGDQYNAFGWAYARGKGKPAADYAQMRNVFSACGGATIYRKAVFEQIGLFDEVHFAYLEDLDIGYRARIFGYRNAYTPDAKVVHYGSASTGSRYNEWKTVQAAANNVYVVYKNMPLLQILWNLPFLLIGFFVKYLFFVRKRMGILYLKGLKKGFGKCFSDRGRKAKIRFQKKNFGNYCDIQMKLYANIFRFSKKD